MDAYICGDIFACVLIMENYHLTAPSFPLKKKKQQQKMIMEGWKLNYYIICKFLRNVKISKMWVCIFKYI